jgi:hypothetical protein
MRWDAALALLERPGMRIKGASRLRLAGEHALASGKERLGQVERATQAVPPYQPRQ